MPEGGVPRDQPHQDREFGVRRRALFDVEKHLEDPMEFTPSPAARRSASEVIAPKSDPEIDALLVQLHDEEQRAVDQIREENGLRRIEGVEPEPLPPTPINYTELSEEDQEEAAREWDERMASMRENDEEKFEQFSAPVASIHAKPKPAWTESLKKHSHATGSDTVVRIRRAGPLEERKKEARAMAAAKKPSKQSKLVDPEQELLSGDREREWGKAVTDVRLGKLEFPTGETNAETAARVEKMQPFERRSLGREFRPSKLHRVILEDIEYIIEAQDNPDYRFTVPSSQVFQRIELYYLQIQASREIGETFPTLKESITVEPGEKRVVNHGRKPLVLDEVVEIEMGIEANQEFGRLSRQLHELKLEGAAEDILFKKILDQVRSFPYRVTANSLTKALATRTRDQIRPKGNIIQELARANERPALNCEARAKMFCALLEDIGYNPETEIFLNWIERHVQVVLKRKDGTWLEFEGWHRRPVIRRVPEVTIGLCSLQEWKYTLYGVPTAKVIESVDPTATAELPPKPTETPQTEPVDQAPPPEPVPTPPKPEAWEENEMVSQVQEKAQEIGEQVTEAFAHLFSSFVGTSSLDERVENAYPKFAPATGPEGEASDMPMSPEEIRQRDAIRRREDAQMRHYGRVDAVRKTLAPKIAAARRALKAYAPLGIPPIALGCWFALGSLYDYARGDQEPTPEDLRQEQTDWAEATDATARDFEVELKSSLEIEAPASAPNLYTGLDLVLDYADGVVTDDADQIETIKHTVQINDEVQTVTSAAIENMIKKDLQLWAQGEDLTSTEWHLQTSDKHPLTLSKDFNYSGTFVVSPDARPAELAPEFHIAWDVDQRTDNSSAVSVQVRDTGRTHILGRVWEYQIVGGRKE